MVLSTPDDIACLRAELVPDGDPEQEAVTMGQARPNVFYEAGMAMGAAGFIRFGWTRGRTRSPAPFPAASAGAEAPVPNSALQHRPWAE